MKAIKIEPNTDYNITPILTSIVTLIHTRLGNSKVLKRIINIPEFLYYI